ncbi:MAG: LysR substrate-binding domain-containing protein [Novosphingobium sp.]|nr:LysR substrate-binding domain-containing protein [Novosphingobium sp.]
MMIRHLPFFVAVAEEENFQRASQRLNIAQSALSRRIRDLEYELGNVPLFVRMPRGVRLTPSGRALLKEARAILDRLDEAREHAVAIMNGDEGTLRIGYSIGAVRHAFISDLLTAFRTAFPKIALKTELLPVEDLQRKLRDSELEASIFYLNEPGEEFESLLIAEEHFLVAMPDDHRLAIAESIAFADIADEDFIWYAKMFSPTVHDRMLAEFAERGAAPRITMESPTCDTTLQLVGARLGLGFVPPVDASRIPANVVLRPVSDFTLGWQFRMVWLRDNKSPILPRLIDAVSAALDGTDTECDDISEQARGCPEDAFQATDLNA